MRTFTSGRFFTLTGTVLMATAAAGAARAGQCGATAAAMPGLPEQVTAASHGRDIYDVINLEAGPFGFSGAINASGQAAFEYYGLDGMLHVGFFDGTRLIDISPPNNETSFLGGLNDRGDVAFTARLAESGSPGVEPFRAFRWSASRGLLPLPSLGSGNTFTTAINDRAEIVGRSALTFADGSYRAARWSAANRLIPLPSPAGIGQTFASDINDRYFTVGYGNRLSGGANALVWDAFGRARLLVPFAASDAYASHINTRGEIAGMLDTLTPDLSAFLWTPGRGAVRVGSGTITHRLNEIGQLVGRRISPGDPAPRAFLYSRARGLVDLHVRGLLGSEANDVNDRGVVVGLVRGSTGARAAYRWTRSLGARDLGWLLSNRPVGMDLTSALAIANNGDILADSNAGVVLLRTNGRGTDAPVLGPILHPQPRLNQRLEIRLNFFDRNRGETHTATVDWGDGSGPRAAGVDECASLGQGRVFANHTYTSNGDYNIIVRVRDSAGRTTRMFERITILELGTPLIRGQGLLPDGAGVDPGAPPLMFRLSAPLAAKPGAPFSFELLGATTFRGEQLDRVTQEGDSVRLEGQGRLDGRDGYRFVIDATPGDAPGAAGTSRIAVRITGADAPGGARRAVFESGSAGAASLRQGSIQLIR